MVARVSVLMAVHNAPLWMLREAVESILQQSYRQLEFVIIDDGSTEPDGLAYVDESAQHDNRLVVLHEPHRGLTRSLNRGLAVARGELIARQDADDWSSLQRLAKQVDFLDTHPEVAVCGTNAWTHQEGGRRLWQTGLPLQDLLAAFPAGNPIVHGSVMFRKAAALELGGYCEAFRCSQDYDFFWRMAERWGAANLAEPLYHYRYTDGSVSANKAQLQQQAHRAIRLRAEARQAGVELDAEDALARALRDLEGNLSRSLLKQADHLMLAGRYRKAARAYLDVLLQQPSNIAAWAKFARLGVFCAAPPLREACFR